MNRRLIFGFFFILLIGVSGVSAVSMVNYQPRPTFQTYYTPEQVGTYWPILGNDEVCRNRQDLILQVAPGGCQPVVVRSDLLAEQNVPVFCQIDALKVNPLIDINQIRNIAFKSEYPEEVAGTGFHPAQAALKTRDKLVGSPLISNIGYVVVVLKQNPKESEIPDKVEVNLQAQVEYDAGNALGIGKAEFLLTEQSDEDWEVDKLRQSFWNGRYSVRVDKLDPNFADVSIYNGDKKIITTRVDRGKTSQDVFLPGMYCQAGLQVAYDNYEAVQKKATIEVNDDVFDVFEDSRFLNNKCKVDAIFVNDFDNTGTVKISCGNEKVSLDLNSRDALQTGEDVIPPGYEFKIGKIAVSSPGSETAVNVKESIGLGSEACEVRLDTGNNFAGDQGLYSIRRGTGALTSGDWVLYYRKNTQVVGDDLEKNGGLEGDSNLWKRTLKNELIRKCESKEAISEIEYDSKTEDYFSSAIAYYEKVAKDYPAEKDPEKAVSDKTETYGELALQEAIRLSEEFKKQATEARLINEFIELYPDSDLIARYEQKLSDLYNTDRSKALQSVYADNKYSTIRLVRLSIPRKEQASADFILGSKKITLGSEGTIPIESPQGGTIRVLELKDAERVKVQIVCNGDKESSASSIKREDYSTDAEYRRALASAYISDFVISGANELNKVGRVLSVQGESIDACGLSLKLDNVNVGKVGRIRIIPNSQGVESTANLTVRIGIEKRNIKLNPEKTKDQIENLNKTIAQWEGISKNLGNVVTGLKSACFATTAVLTAKNFFTGLSGEAIARQKVMRGENGWTTRCGDLVPSKYPTLNACYVGEADNINKDVSAAKDVISQVNSKIGSIEGPLKQDSGILGTSKSVDRSKAAIAYADYLNKAYGDREIVLQDGTKTTVGNLIGDPASSYNDAGAYRYDQLREIETNLLLRDKGVSQGTIDNANSNLQGVAEKVQENRDLYDKVLQSKDLEGKGYASPARISVEGRQTIYADVKKIENSNEGLKKKANEGYPSFGYTSTVVVPTKTVNFDKQNNGAGKTFAGGTYALLLNKQPDGLYGIDGVVEVDSAGNAGEALSQQNTNLFVQTYGLGSIQAYSDLSYNNKMTNAEVKYYETEPYKGLPAVVPFDAQRGWYAATKPTLAAFGNIGTFDASGKVSSFWLCNVGKNGRIQFEEGLGDDICQQINLNTGQPLGLFHGLGEREAEALVNRAISAINEAANQYGKKVVTIEGDTFTTGKPAATIPGTQCQDFMSTGDCQLLFNVCDPVICPSSRCDLGGKYPVADVIQTGIVGSALLCLPNVREGIAIPVCLTGIQAGIDGYVSILKSHRDCLQENLDTGQLVGICDQITSVYMCEFFWRQVAPIANILLPKLVETAYGQGTRGGGEYLTVMGAWQNTQNSINYFTQSYASNSLKAFQARNVEEAGGEFCKAFISAKAPTAFKTLVEPDSPTQFHAWFDSFKSNSATVPATAQYKVFYHIFAGNDQGVQFSVYLKNPPETSYYSNTPTIQVAANFIPRGSYATETRDFTAPEGYQELCVKINADEKCGFKQVSTSFAVNSLRDGYVGDQINQKNIQSATECVSGTPSLGAVVGNTNPQSALEEAALPEIYNRGVIRICATQNPGTSTDPTRFSNVGYCDDQKVICWLDKESVDNAITDSNVGLKDATLSELEDSQKKSLVSAGEILSDQTAASRIRELRESKNVLVGQLGKSQNLDGSGDLVLKTDKLVQDIESGFDLFFYNYHKAELILMQGELKGGIAGALVKRAVVKFGETPAPSDDSTRGGVPRDGLGADTTLKVGDKIKDSEGNVLVIESVNGDGSYVAKSGSEKLVTITLSDIQAGKYSSYSEVSSGNLPTVEGTDLNKVQTIALTYTEGYDDSFAFRWNSQTNKPEVIMEVWAATAFFGAPGMHALSVRYGWVEDPSIVPNFKDQDGIYAWEKEDVERIMASETWDELILRVFEVKKFNSLNTMVFFPKSQETTEVFNGDEEIIRDSREVSKVVSDDSVIAVLDVNYNPDSRERNYIRGLKTGEYGFYVLGSKIYFDESWVVRVISFGFNGDFEVATLAGDTSKGYKIVLDTGKVEKSFGTSGSIVEFLDSLNGGAVYYESNKVLKAQTISASDESSSESGSDNFPTEYGAVYSGGFYKILDDSGKEVGIKISSDTSGNNNGANNLIIYYQAEQSGISIGNLYYNDGYKMKFDFSGIVKNYFMQDYGSDYLQAFNDALSIADRLNNAKVDGKIENNFLKIGKIVVKS